MRILVACEFSQIVTTEFRALGHDAFSCDLLPTEGNPQYHYQCDILELLSKDTNWDLMVAPRPVNT